MKPTTFTEEDREQLGRIESLLRLIAPTVKRVHQHKGGTNLEKTQDAALVRVLRNLFKLTETERAKLVFPACLQVHNLQIVPRSLVFNRVNKLICFQPDAEQAAELEANGSTTTAFHRQAFNAALERCTESFVTRSTDVIPGICDVHTGRSVDCVLSVGEAAKRGILLATPGAPAPAKKINLKQLSKGSPKIPKPPEKKGGVTGFSLD